MIYSNYEYSKLEYYLSGWWSGLGMVFSLKRKRNGCFCQNQVWADIFFRFFGSFQKARPQAPPTCPPLAEPPAACAWNYAPFRNSVLIFSYKRCQKPPWKRWFLAGAEGIAPHHLAGVEGIEPSLSVLETDVLPLNYTPTKWCGVGDRCSTVKLRPLMKSVD